MLYTASWKKEDCFHGKVFSVSLGTPNVLGVEVSHLDFFKPKKELLDFWYSSDKSDLAWAEYERQYWALMNERRPLVMQWIEEEKRENPHQDKTLCCHELKNKHCHRRLVQAVINKYLPGLWGGDNILSVQEDEEQLEILAPAELEVYEPPAKAKERTAPIEKGDRVVHTRVDKGPGTVLWTQATLAYVIWDRLPLGKVEIVQHPIKHDNKYNRFGDPLPFPMSLLEIVEGV